MCPGSYFPSCFSKHRTGYLAMYQFETMLRSEQNRRFSSDLGRVASTTATAEGDGSQHSGRLLSAARGNLTQWGKLGGVLR